MRSTKSLKYNFLMNVILTVSSMVFPIVTFPYVSRVLLPEGTGKVSLASSIISYFLLISQLGIPSYGIKICAKVREDKDKLSRIVQELLIISMIMSILAYIALFVMFFYIPKFREEKALYYVMSSSILLGAIGIEWLYKGLEDYSYITARSIIFKLIAVIAMFLFVRDANDYVIYGGIMIVAASASNILNFIYARGYIFHRSSEPFNFRRHVKAILIFFSMSCATTIYTNLDVTMLGFFRTNIEVGYYMSAIKIKQFLVGMITSLGSVLLPRSSYYVANNEIEKFWAISKKALSLIFLIAFPLMVYFILFARESVLFLSGDAYRNAIIPMKILMPTLLFISLTNILGIQILIPLNKEKYVLKSVTIGAIVNFFINTLLIPQYGAIGAAIGTITAEGVVLVYQFIIIKCNVEGFAMKVPVAKICFSTLVSAIVSQMVFIISTNNFITLVVSASIFFIVYFGFLIIVKEKTTIEMFETVLSGLKKRRTL